ncbi:MAG: amidinotransferase [Chloroflexi bacterium]|nr:amidinotransferase [Chloroflexota bacterium]
MSHPIYAESGEKWFSDEGLFSDQLKDYWGEWGCASEVGALRAVMLRRPGKEIERVTDPAEWRWLDVMDPVKARAQFDNLADIYRRHGARVVLVEEMREDRPNALFMRDSVFMTPEGAIVARHAMPFRRGEERYAALTLARHGVPIVRTVTGTGTFEGACAMWVDRRTVILGTGVRCNAEGARQVSEALRGMGVEEIIPFQIPYGHAHVDGLMNMLDYNLCMIFPWQVPHDVVMALRKRGYEILEAPSLDEIKNGSALNWVALGPRKVVFPAGNPRTRDLLESKDVDVIEVDVSEIRKGWGAIHCMSVFLKRDEP